MQAFVCHAILIVNENGADTHWNHRVPDTILAISYHYFIDYLPWSFSFFESFWTMLEDINQSEDGLHCKFQSCLALLKCNIVEDQI